MIAGRTRRSSCRCRYHEELSDYCSEFLVHAADVEGKCEGIDERLVEFLGSHCPIPVTYAGGARSFEDLATVDRLSEGKVDLTVGAHSIYLVECRFNILIAWSGTSKANSFPTVVAPPTNRMRWVCETYSTKPIVASQLEYYENSARSYGDDHRLFDLLFASPRTDLALPLVIAGRLRI